MAVRWQKAKSGETTRTDLKSFSVRSFTVTNTSTCPSNTHDALHSLCAVHERVSTVTVAVSAGYFALVCLLNAVSVQYPYTLLLTRQPMAVNVGDSATLSKYNPVAANIVHWRVCSDRCSHLSRCSQLCHAQLTRQSRAYTSTDCGGASRFSLCGIAGSRTGNSSKLQV